MKPEIKRELSKCNIDYKILNNVSFVLNFQNLVNTEKIALFELKDHYKMILHSEIKGIIKEIKFDNLKNLNSNYTSLLELHKKLNY